MMDNIKTLEAEWSGFACNGEYELVCNGNRIAHVWEHNGSWRGAINTVGLRNDKSDWIRKNSFIEMALVVEKRLGVKTSHLLRFQQEVGDWGDKTFNHKRENNSKAIAHHLFKEATELLYSNEPEEAADCFLLLLHHAHINGYDLLAAAKAKMVINRKRKWGKPDKNGVVEHIKGEVNYE